MLVSKYFRNRTFPSEFGEIYVDATGMRVDSISVAYFNPAGERTVTSLFWNSKFTIKNV